MPAELLNTTLRPVKRATGSFTRRSFLKTLSAAGLAAPFVTRDLLALPPSGVLGHASFGASGMAWEDLTQMARSKRVRLLAVADVDLRRTAGGEEALPEHENLPGLARTAGCRGQASRLGQRLHPRPHACAHRHERACSWARTSIARNPLPMTSTKRES